ncbi:MAG: hypothetical protein LBT59_21030 [Clostridiales bacterium]|nr:hypothetical protein [Clostridiales bacterium]
MAFASVRFFLFLALAMAIYFFAAKKARWIALLVLSLAFYVGAASAKLALAMAGMSLWAYLAGLAIREFGIDEEGAKNLPQKKRLIATIAILFEAGILIALKENAFFVTNANLLLGLSLPFPEWVAPLGVSYYTLMLIGYICDVHWEICQAEKNFFKFLLFTCFFPQMLSGPISRYGDVKDQLFEGNAPSLRQISLGFSRIAWGYFKKVVVADGLALVVGYIFQDFNQSRQLLLLGAFCYSLQLYADFSGLMDIVIGIGSLFGVKLPENFRQPFFSASLSELWQRWHMSLGVWLRNYIFYPFQKSKRMAKVRALAEKAGGRRAGGEASKLLSLLVLWVSIGFWHGGTWKYIFGAGLFFFAMISLGIALNPLSKKVRKLLRINPNNVPFRIFQSLRTFVLFSISISFCRMGSFRTGISYWQSVFSNIPSQRFWSASLLEAISLKELFVVIAGLAIMLLVSVFQLNKDIEEFFQNHASVRWAAFLSLAFAAIIFGFYGIGYNAQDFIYGDF